MIPDELSNRRQCRLGANPAPGHAAGVFFRHQKEIQPMTKNSTQNGKPHPDDDGPKKKDRIDVNPPFSEHVQRFQRLLAELIARQIIAARRTPPAPDQKKEQ